MSDIVAPTTLTNFFHYQAGWESRFNLNLFGIVLLVALLRWGIEDL